MKILNDIFGKDIEDTHYGGLIDCESEDIFTASFNSLIDAWKNMVPHSFIEWFRTTIPAIISSMLAPVREKAGLGKPPRPFYNYRSESINHVIKEGVEYRKQDLPDFILSLQNIISSQIEMIKLAIFRRGDYRFIDNLKYLEIHEDTWLYKMSESQKKNHFAKIMKITVQDALQNALQDAGGDCTTTKPLSISWQEARLSNSNLHAVTLGNIWRKAERLMSSSNFIKERSSLVPYPSQSQQFFVYSFSTDQPYTVNAASDLVTCNCPMYKSSPKICSHAVACAEKVGKLSTYLQSVTKSVSGRPDPTGLALSVRGINKKSSGCKGEKANTVRSKHSGSVIVNHVPTEFLEKHSEQSAVTGLLMLAQQPLRTITTSQLNVFASRSDSLPKQSKRPDRPEPVPNNSIFLLRTIEGNIRKCAGCGKPLTELPLHSMYTASSVDAKFCIAHQERDWYFCKNDGLWKLGRLQNRHFHINIDCLKNRNPSLQIIASNQFAVSAKCVANDIVKAVVNSRLGVNI